MDSEDSMELVQPAATKPNPDKAAEGMVFGGLTMRESFLRAGYAETTASTSMRQKLSLSKSFRNSLSKQIGRWAENTDLVPLAQARAGMVRLRLLMAMCKGKDRDAIAAAKLIGQDREVNMFEPESSIGVVVVNAPQDIKTRYEK